MGRAVRRFVLLVAALALVPSQGFGWGRDGHQVIANLAQSRLSPQARKGVAALLHGATLASVSTYADNYRNNHPETARWHYVNIPLDDGHYDPARDCAPSPESDCILAAIDRFTAILADPSRPQDERAGALKFLVHFVADLHQPLHATTNNDRGGNDTAVTFFGQPTNLHAVWDSGLMERTGLTVAAWTDLLNRSGMSEDGAAAGQLTPAEVQLYRTKFANAEAGSECLKALVRRCHGHRVLRADRLLGRRFAKEGSVVPGNDWKTAKRLNQRHLGAKRLFRLSIREYP